MGPTCPDQRPHALSFKLPAKRASPAPLSYLISTFAPASSSFFFAASASALFIGGGPAGTAGGIKVTTFGVLFFILLAEIRGDGVVNVFGKRLSRAVHRQAIAVVLLAVAVIVLATIILLLLTPHDLEDALFESVSAFATVGLSTGITASLPPAGQVVLVIVMFVGRLGPITFATAMALRQREILYQFPKERPIIG